MTRYILIYTADSETNPGDFESWQRYLDEGLRGHVVDPGWPIMEASQSVGNTGPGTRLCGYSVIESDDLASAIELANGCPTLSSNGGVEVAPLAVISR